MRDLQVAFGVAEGGDGVFEVGIVADEGDGVAELQAGVAVGDEFDAGAAHAGDVHTEAFVDVEAGEFFVADRALGDVHPHGVDVGGRGGARFVAEDAGADLTADEGHQALGFVVAGDDEEDVALLDAFVFFGEGDFAVA